MDFGFWVQMYPWNTFLPSREASRGSRTGLYQLKLILTLSEQKKEHTCEYGDEGDHGTSIYANKDTVSVWAVLRYFFL